MLLTKSKLHTGYLPKFYSTQINGPILIIQTDLLKKAFLILNKRLDYIIRGYPGEDSMIPGFHGPKRPEIIESSLPQATQIRGDRHPGSETNSDPESQGHFRTFQT